MAIQYSRYETGIDLQDYSGSYSSNAGAIYLSGAYMNFRSDLDMNSAGISNMADPSAAQDAATKAYVDAQITAQDLDLSGDTGTTGSSTLTAGSLIESGSTIAANTVLVLRFAFVIVFEIILFIKYNKNVFSFFENYD